MIPYEYLTEMDSGTRSGRKNKIMLHSTLKHASVETCLGQLQCAVVFVLLHR